MLIPVFKVFLYSRKTNKRPVILLKNGTEIDSTAERICVGDIIVLSEDDVVPCDAVILSTSNDSHQVRKSGLRHHKCMPTL